MVKLSTKHQSQSSGWIERYNIRLMPHGGMILIPITLVTIAWLASISTNGCDFSRLTGAGVEMLTGSSIIPYIHLGMNAYVIPEFYPMSNSWQVSIESECMPYQYPVEDNAWIAGKRFGFLSLWAGSASAILLWVGTFIVLTPRQWKAAGVLVLFACLFQVLSFAWFNTALCHTTSTRFSELKSDEINEASAEDDGGESSCSLFYGSRCAIASLLLYLVSSAMILLGEYPIPEPKLIAKDNYEMLTIASS